MSASDNPLGLEPYNGDKSYDIIAASLSGTGGDGKRRETSPLMGTSERAIARHVLDEIEKWSHSEHIVSDGSNVYVYRPKRGIWERIPRDTLISLLLQLEGVSCINDDTGKWGQLKLTYRKCESAYKVMLLDYDRHRPEFTENIPNGITCKNGFVSIHDNGVRMFAHSPHQRSTVAIDLDFDKEAKCPHWDKFLDDLFANDDDKDQKIAVLQEFIGASLLGIAPQFQKCVAMIGDGSNGKSVLLDIIDVIFPEGSICSVTPDKFGHEYYAVALDGKRINIVTEVQEGRFAATASFKAVITGDQISARMPYGQIQRFRPRCGHIFSFNQLPATTDFNKGFWRRFMCLTFNRDFDAEPEIQVMPEILMKRMADEHAGIFVWALRGAKRALQQGHYTTPNSHNEAMRDWRREADAVQDFVGSVLELDGETETRSIEMYNAFKDWCDKTHRKPLSMQSFGRRLRYCRVPKRQKNYGAVYVAKLRPTTDWFDFYN